MASAVRLSGLPLALSVTLAVGAPQDGGPLLERRVFPPTKEGDLWWVSVRDVCDLVGAQLEGDGFGYKVTGENALRLEVWGRFGGNGPFTIAVGEDVYGFRLDGLAIEKNGEPFGDFLVQPKRIGGVVCATLEDLARILGFEVGDEVDGQPTIAQDGQRYRLVPGEPRGAFRIETLRPGDVFRANPEALPRRLEQAPFLWRGWPGARGPQPETAVYTEHNGLTYRRGTWGIQVGPYAPTRAVGSETLFGPVVPNRFHAEGQSADLLYLSIVKRRLPTGGVAGFGPPGPGQDPPRGDRAP